MIKKKKEDYQFVEGAGRPFEMNPRSPIEKSDAERQKSLVINLSELNGDDEDSRVPKNFHPKRGRILPTFTKYLTQDQLEENVEEGFDVE